MSHLEIAAIVAGSIVGYAVTFGACVGIVNRWFHYDKWCVDQRQWYWICVLIIPPIVLIAAASCRFCQPTEKR